MKYHVYPQKAEGLVEEGTPQLFSVGSCSFKEWFAAGVIKWFS